MVINLSEIMSVKGRIKHIEVPFEQKRFKLNGEEYEIVSRSMVNLTISNLGNHKVNIDGDVKLSILIPCSRCLENVETFFDIHISKGLDFNDTDSDRIRELDEANYVEGYNLDVDLLVCDEIVLDFPLKVLCNENCKGICNICGKNLNKEVCDCDRTVGDPRMSAIQDIFKNSI